MRIKSGLKWFFLVFLALLVSTTLFCIQAPAALNFDNGNFVQVEDSPSLDITGQITLEAWIYKTWNGEDWNIIFSKPWDYDGNPWHVYRLGITYVGDQPKYATCSLALSGGVAGVESTSVIPNNTWVHLACTYDGSTMKMYMNGSLEGTTPVSGTIATNDQPVFIGRNFLNSWNDWFGTIDDVRIWNVARTGPQIRESMNRRLTGTEPGLAGYWRFAEGTGTTTADASGNGNTGTLVGSPSWVNGGPLCTPTPSGLVSWWGGDNNTLDIIGTNNGILQGGATYASGKVGQAFSFDGGENTYVEIPNSSSLNPSGAFSVDGWFYIDPAANAGKIATFASKSEGSSATAWAIYFDDRAGVGSSKSLKFVLGTVLEFPNAITTANWYHIAGVYDPAATPNAKLYLNGTQVAFGSGSPSSNTLNVRIGAMYWTDTYHQGNDRLNGKADEVEFFNRALSADEITAIYNAGSAGKCRPCAAPPSGMVSWWGGENNALDRVGGFNATLHGDTIYAAGKVGQSFSFDGNGDYVSVPQSANLPVRGTNSFTIDAWVKNSDGSMFNVFAYRPSENSNLQFFIDGATTAVWVPEHWLAQFNHNVDSYYLESLCLCQGWQYLASLREWCSGRL